MVNYSRVKKVIESMYEGTCTVYSVQKTKDPGTKETVFAETAIITDAPCRLSFSSSPTTNIVSGVPAFGQATQLFISPSANIPPGSKLVVTQNGTTSVYSNSGEPARYTTHQAINLDLFKGWA